MSPDFLFISTKQLSMDFPTSLILVGDVVVVVASCVGELSVSSS